MEAKDADLLVDVTYEIREDPIDRRRWRQYACAALASGACTRLRIGRDGVPGIEGTRDADTKRAARYADEMLALEKARFDGGAK